MPNLYASVWELKAALPDSFRPTTTKYDALLLRLGAEISRHIDEWCHRIFYPTLAVRVFDGSGGCAQWVPDLLSITTVEYSLDDGATYATLSSADYFATVAGDYNSPRSYNQLVLDRNNTALAVWPRGQRSLRITGTWAYADDRDAAWESTGDTVEDNPLTSGATTLTVNAAGGLDLYGGAPRFQPGQLYQIESEIVESTLLADVTANTVGILRGRNGTTAAQHAQNVAISVWRPPELVKQAAIVQAVRAFQRGSQGFSDGRGGEDGSEFYYMRHMDPDAVAKLALYRQPTVG